LVEIDAGRLAEVLGDWCPHYPALSSGLSKPAAVICNIQRRGGRAA
jgi:hypothetical protein